MARRMLRAGVGGDVAKSPVITPRPGWKQAALRFDLMPDRVEPCLAVLTTKAPTGDGYATRFAAS